VKDVELLRDELQRWRSSIPNHIRFTDPMHDVDDDSEKDLAYSWEKRQESSLLIRTYIVQDLFSQYRHAYDHQIITLP
jgi:hypothetical protein